MKPEGIAIREAMDHLGRLGPMSGADEYRVVQAMLAPYWNPDPVCGVQLATGFIDELVSGTTDPIDREGSFDEAISWLFEEARAQGGYSDDELLAFEMDEAAAMDAFMRELGQPPDDLPFPEAHGRA